MRKKRNKNLGYYTYRDAYGDGCIAKMGLIYPLIEDDVSKAHSVNIHFKSMAMVKEINELLIHFLLSEDIRRIKKNSCDRNQATHCQT